MFKNKKKAKDNFEWGKWIGAALVAVGTATITVCSGAISIIEKSLKEK